MILFDDVSKKYLQSVFALDEINFKVENGEFIFLVGPSGAGKTTILRLVTREILPSHGSVFLDDWEINKLPTSKLPYLRRKVGVIFQDFRLLSGRTVAENIAVAQDVLGKSKKETEERIKEILATIQLEGKTNYFPKQLSLGEQQRVAIGRAIAGETKVLLADEPTGNLDPKTSWEVLKILNQINRSGTTVIMATHNVDIVNSLKKRVIKLQSGKIVADEKRGKYA